MRKWSEVKAEKRWNAGFSQGLRAARELYLPHPNVYTIDWDKLEGLEELEDITTPVENTRHTEKVDGVALAMVNNPWPDDEPVTPVSSLDDMHPGDAAIWRSHAAAAIAYLRGTDDE